MILQRKNAPPVDEPNTPPGSYPNLKYDLETFHFLGEDLRYSVELFAKDAHDFVLLTGDVMTGNLEIKFPGEGDHVETEPAQLKLSGYQNDGDAFSRLLFQNNASGSGFNISIDAVHPVSSSSANSSHFKIGEGVAITKEGRVYVNKSVVSHGNGFLAYAPTSDWDLDANLINNTVGNDQVRLTWTDYGGNLKNPNNVDCLRWSNNNYGVKINDQSGNTVVKTLDTRS